MKKSLRQKNITQNDNPSPWDGYDVLKLENGIYHKR